MWIVIVLGILAFFALLLILPLVLRVEYTDQLQIIARYGLLRFRIVPRKEKPKKKRAKKDADDRSDRKKAKKKKEKKGGTFQNLVEKQGAVGAVQTLVSAALRVPKVFWRLIRGARVRSLRVVIGVTGEDAAAAAIRYGQVCAVFYPFLGVMDHHMKIIRPNINVYADYNGEKPTVSGGGTLYISSFHAIGTILYGIKTIILNHKGGKNNERTNQSSTSTPTDPKE